MTRHHHQLNNRMLHQTMEELGGSVGDSMTDNWPFTYAVDFNNVAQLATASSSVRIEAGTDFLCQAILGSFNFNSAGTPTGLPVRAKLLRNVSDGYITATPENNAFLSQVLLRFGVTDRQFSNAQMRADLCTCEPGAPMLLPTPWLIAASDSLTIELQNNLPALTGLTAPAIDGHIEFLGMKMARR